MRRWGVLLLVAALIGCAAPPSWTRVDLPGGFEPDVLQADRDTLLVGTRRTDHAGPGLIRLGPDGTAEQLPVTPGSPYGREARWTALAGDAEDLVALGGIRGGAHGNVRWSVWRGSTDGLAEQPQTFDTFGGWGAGDLTTMLVDSTGPVVVGSWGADVGLQTVMWRPQGSRWVRGDTPDGLENSLTELRQVRAAAVSDGKLVLLGRVTRLGTRPTVLPTAWVTQGDGFRAIQLDEEGTSAESLACADGTCVILGRRGDALTCWTLTNDLVTSCPLSATGLTADALPAPVVTPTGPVAVVATTQGSRWVSAEGTRPGPPGTPFALANASATLWVATEDNGVRSLWRLR